MQLLIQMAGLSLIVTLSLGPPHRTARSFRVIPRHDRNSNVRSDKWLETRRHLSLPCGFYDAERYYLWRRSNVYDNRSEYGPEPPRASADLPSRRVYPPRGLHVSSRVHHDFG